MNSAAAWAQGERFPVAAVHIPSHPVEGLSLHNHTDHLGELVVVEAGVAVAHQAGLHKIRWTNSSQTKSVRCKELDKDDSMVLVLRTRPNLCLLNEVLDENPIPCLFPCLFPYPNHDPDPRLDPGVGHDASDHHTKRMVCGTCHRCQEGQEVQEVHILGQPGMASWKSVAGVHSDRPHLDPFQRCRETD